MSDAEVAEVAEAVRRGLAARPKRLPPWLLYDAVGSALYEAITATEAYYPTRTERAIFAAHADAIVALALQGSDAPLHVVELGAGSAAKTTLLLAAALRARGRCDYLPVDVSPTALAEATARVRSALPAVDVVPLAGRHEDALPRVRALGPRRLVLFIGSSVGNHDDAEAVALLARVRGALDPGCALLLGTDLRKPVPRLLAAYDDPAGVTAAFDKNLLARINRELGADFDLTRFAHRARWNDALSRVEMHLEALAAQEVFIRELGMRVSFERGETIHTESSVKYDLPRVEAMLGAAGFALAQTFSDPEGLFAVHLARVPATG